jgi:hypothetical protein
MRLLPNGKQTFFDNNGDPLNAGKVYHYIPGTTTFKDTWQDRDAIALNTNPIILDAAGRAVIWGDGAYRQVLKDSLDNTIWDQIVTTFFEQSLGLSVSIGTPEEASIVVSLDRSMALLEDAAGSTGRCDGAPASTTVVDLHKNGVSFGSCTFASGANSPTFECPATSFVRGDWITFVFPVTTMTDIGITLTMIKE